VLELPVAAPSPVRDDTVTIDVVRAPKQIRDDGDFTIALDPDGLVIYYSIRGRRFFFHGHLGLILDDLPEYAIAVYDTLLLPEAEQDAQFRKVARKYGKAAKDLISDLRQTRTGDHPGLVREDRQEGFQSSGVPGIFNTYLAQTCNLACGYCFNQRGTFGKEGSVMTLETAKEVLPFIKQCVEKAIYPYYTVNLFGGEPTLAKEAVRYLARGLQDLNNSGSYPPVHIMLSTNGTVYEEDLYRILAEGPETNTVIVSLDAFKDTHDRNRPFANEHSSASRAQSGRAAAADEPGATKRPTDEIRPAPHEDLPLRAEKSSYDVVAANVRRMVAEGIPCALVCVVPHPHDFIGSAQALHEFGVPIVEVKQLNNHIHGRPQLPELFDRDFETWRQNYLDYGEFHLDYIASGGRIHHVDRFAIFGDVEKAATVRMQRKALACGVLDSKIGIAADGTLFPCEAFLRHDHTEVGHVRDGFDPEKYRTFEEMILARGQHRVDNEQCRTCYAKTFCGGGCYAESYDRSGKMAPMHPAECRFVRERVKIDFFYLAQLKGRFPGLYEAVTTATD
jgi:uncharacterized protein